MRINAKDITLASVFASLYFVINFIQAATIGNPAVISGPVQLRVADCLIALPALLGWPVVAGVALGGIVTNIYAFIDPLDLILGPLANLIAASIVLLLRRHRFIGCIIAALTVGFIVGGGYLWLLFPPPSFGLELPAWLGMTLSITISSLISITIIGYALLRVLERTKIVDLRDTLD